MENYGSCSATSLPENYGTPCQLNKEHFTFVPYVRTEKYVGHGGECWFTPLAAYGDAGKCDQNLWCYRGPGGTIFDKGKCCNNTESSC